MFEARIEEMVEARARAIAAKRVEIEARTAAVIQLTSEVEKALGELVEQANARSAELGLGDGLLMDVSVSAAKDITGGSSCGRVDFIIHRSPKWVSEWTAKDGVFRLELPDPTDAGRRTAEALPASAVPRAVVKSALAWLTKYTATNAI